MQILPEVAGGAGARWATPEVTKVLLIVEGGVAPVLRLVHR